MIMKKTIAIILAILMMLTIPVMMPNVKSAYGDITHSIVSEYMFDSYAIMYEDVNCLLRINNSEYYAISYSDSSYYTHVQTVQISNDNGSIIGTTSSFVVDFVSPCYHGQIVQVPNTDIYAIIFFSGSDMENFHIETIRIWDTNGTIQPSVIDNTTWFIGDVVITRTPYPSFINNNVLAVAYSGANFSGILDTYWIDSDGQINDTKLDNIIFDNVHCWFPIFALVDSDTIVMSYMGSGDIGTLISYNITSNGDISDNCSDSWQYDTEGKYESLREINNNMFAISYSDFSYYLQLKTFIVSNDGIFTKSWIDTLTVVSTGAILYSFIYPINEKRIYAVNYNDGGSAYTNTVNISASGDIGDSFIDSYMYFPETGWYPLMVYVNNSFYLYIFIYLGGYSGYARTLEIATESLIFSGNGSGISGDPYQITNCDELNQTRNFLDANFTLMNNINMSECGVQNWNGGTGFIPIGNDITPFTGSFDGQNYSIHNLYINNPLGSFQGLFGYIGTGSVVKNLELNPVNISGAISFGGMVGCNYGTITNCHDIGLLVGQSVVSGLVGKNYGSVIDSYTVGEIIGIVRVGGLIAENYGLVDHCYSTGSIFGNSTVGGLVGYNEGIVNNSYSFSTVVGTVLGEYTYYVGGLVGLNNGTISNSYCGGTVLGDGETSVGGLVGLNNYNIINSYNTGDIIGIDTLYNVGGLVGENTGNISDSYSTGNVTGTYCVGGLVGLNIHNISKCHTTGIISGSNNYCVGGLVGLNYVANISNSYSMCNIIGNDTSYIGGLVGSNYLGSVSNSYSIGNLVGILNYVGGLVGFNFSGIATNSYWDNETSGQTVSSGGEGRTTAQMTYDYDGYDPPCTGLYEGWDLANYSGGSEDSMWVHDVGLNQNNGYPLFREDYVNHAPDKPTCITPTDNSTGVSIDTTLKCHVVDIDNDTMVVSFYWSNNTFITNFPNVISNSDVETFNLSLQYDTPYSWYAMAYDSTDITQSDNFTFTTESAPLINHAPNQPTLISPINYIDNVSINTKLKCHVVDVDNDNMTVTFYWFNNATPIETIYNVANNTDVESSALNLEYNTSYAWNVIANDSVLQNLSNTEGFTTELAPLPPVNHRPSVTNLNPLDDSIDVPISGTHLECYVYDIDNDLLNVTFYDNLNNIIYNAGNQPDGQLVKTSDLTLSYDTEYSWYVVVNDSLLENNSNMWSFTTESQPIIPPTNNAPDKPTAVYPVNDSSDVPLSIRLEVHAVDMDNDSMVVSFYWINDSFIGNVTGVVNNSYVLSSLLDLNYDTQYSWYTESYDGTNVTRSDNFTFGTLHLNHAPDKPILNSPANNSINVSINTALNITAYDSDGDNTTCGFYWANATLIENILYQPNGYRETYPLSLAYNTTYSWYAISSDGLLQNQSATFIFTTRQSSIDHPPSQPTNEVPANNSNYIAPETYMNVTITDPDNDNMTVTFKWQNGTTIATLTNVANNSVANIWLPDYQLISHNTNYYWCVIVSDGIENTTSPIWNFHTSMAWDLNGDKTVNYLDVSALVSHYGETGVPGWIPEDINSDGVVNYLDVSSLVSHYGEHY